MYNNTMKEELEDTRQVCISVWWYNSGF